MLDIKSTAFLINSITFLLAYFFVVTTTGAFRAWVAEKMGDDTAEQLGFLTLNPIIHASPIGLVLLILTSFGWGKHVPINPFNFYGKNRYLRMAIAYYSNVFLHMVLAIIGLCILLWWFGPMVINFVYSAIGRDIFSHASMGQFFTGYSTISLVIGFIIVAMVALHIGLAVLDFLLDTCMLGLAIFAEDQMSYMQYSLHFTLFAPLILIWFFYRPMLIVVIKITTYTGVLLAHMIGAF